MILTGCVSILKGDYLGSGFPTCCPRELPWYQAGNPVAYFLESFEKKFEEVPLVDKKDLLRKVIEKTMVYPENRTVNCYFKRIP